MRRNLQVCCFPVYAEQPVTARQPTTVHGACLSTKDAVPLLLNRGVSHRQDNQCTHYQGIINQCNVCVFSGDECMSYPLEISQAPMQEL